MFKRTLFDMNLEKNLIDNVLECEVKLGHSDIPLTFFYPASELCELLKCSSDMLTEAISDFRKSVMNTLGDVTVSEVKSEKGRYGITVPVTGVNWISKNYKVSDFVKAFVEHISSYEASVTSVTSLFKSFSDSVEIKKLCETETAIWFTDYNIDPYVYFLEQNDFGLEYHRYTHEAYEASLKEHHHHG